MLAAEQINHGSNGDFYCADIAGQFVNSNVGGVPSLKVGTTDLILARHLDTTNVVFCDGHVKSTRTDVLLKTNAAGALPIFTIEND